MDIKIGGYNYKVGFPYRDRIFFCYTKVHWGFKIWFSERVFGYKIIKIIFYTVQSRALEGHVTVRLFRGGSNRAFMHLGQAGLIFNIKCEIISFVYNRLLLNLKMNSPSSCFNLLIRNNLWKLQSLSPSAIALTADDAKVSRFLRDLFDTLMFKNWFFTDLSKFSAALFVRIKNGCYIRGFFG